MKNILMSLLFLFTQAASAAFLVPDGSIVAKKIGGGDPKNILGCHLQVITFVNFLVPILRNQAGANPTSGDPCRISFKTSATGGGYSLVSVTANTQLGVSVGSTLGMVSGVAGYLYVYALNNAGTVEIAISSTLYDEGTLQTTIAEGGAGAADSASVLYSATARSNIAIRLIGRVLISEATAGTWATGPTEVAIPPFKSPPPVDIEVVIDTGNGHGSTGTAIRRFTTVNKNTLGAYATYVDSATAGMSVTINIAGKYSIYYTDSRNAVDAIHGISVNSAGLATSIVTLTYAQGKRAAVFSPISGQRFETASTTLTLAAGDVIRAQDDGTNDLATDDCYFQLIYIGP